MDSTDLSRILGLMSIVVAFLWVAYFIGLHLYYLEIEKDKRTPQQKHYEDVCLPQIEAWRKTSRSLRQSNYQYPIQKQREEGEFKYPKS